MAVTYEASGFTSVSPASTNWSFSPDAGTLAGDVLVAQVYAQDNSVTLTPPGEIVYFLDGPGAGDRLVVFAWVAPTNAPGPVNIGISGSAQGVVSWARFRGVNTSDATDVFSQGYNTGNSNAPSTTAPSMTTTGTNRYIVGGLAIDSGSRTVAINTWPTTLNDTTTPRRAPLALKGVQSSAGATGATPTWNVSGDWDGPTFVWQVALTPDEGGPALPVLSNLVLGIPTPTSIETRVKSDADSVRLKVGNNSGVTTGVVWGESVTPDANNWCAPVSGTLPPDTQYWLQVEMTKNSTPTLSAASGPFRTAPTPGTPKTFDVCFGGDLQDDQHVATSFNNMTARNPSFVFSNGDSHDGDNTSSSQSSHRQDWENIWSTNGGFKNMIASVPFAQSFGDHDQGGGNNSVPGAWTAPNIAAYRQVLPPPPSPHLPNTTNWSFVWGRVRFISPDWGHERAPTYKLGTAQMSWLESELNQTEPIKVLLVGSVWYDTDAPEGWPSGDGWADYPEQRADIIELIKKSPGLVLGVHGDQHALAAMSGAGNIFGGFPVVAGSPWSTFSSHKGVLPPDIGRWPTTAGVLTQQYGRLTFTDDSNNITVQYRGYDSTNTQRVSMVVSTAPTASYLSNPTNRWSKGTVRPLWHNGSDWCGVLPTAQGSRIHTITQSGNTSGSVVDERQDARVCVVHYNGNTYALAGHSSESKLTVYDSGMSVVRTSTVPLNASDHDASPMTLHRTTNGYLWAAVATGGQTRVARSTDNGATWGASTSVVSLVAQTGVVAFAQSEDLLVMFASENDGGGRHVRTIAQTASNYTSGNWTTESIPALPSGVTSDDHLSAGAAWDGRVLVVTKTTDATTAGHPLIHSLIRSTDGTWTGHVVEPGPDSTPRYSRPVLTIAGSLAVLHYTSIDAPQNLFRRTLDLSAQTLQWSSRTSVLSGPDYSDSTVAPSHVSASLWPIVTHNRSDGSVRIDWVDVWQAIPDVEPEPEPSVYVGTKKVIEVRVGSNLAWIE